MYGGQRGVALIAAALAVGAAVAVVAAAVALDLGDGVLPEGEVAFRPIVAAAYPVLAAVQVVGVVVGAIQVALVGLAGIGLDGGVSLAVAVVMIVYLMHRDVLDAFVLLSLERQDRDASGAGTLRR